MGDTPRRQLYGHHETRETGYIFYYKELHYLNTRVLVFLAGTVLSGAPTRAADQVNTAVARRRARPAHRFCSLHFGFPKCGTRYTSTTTLCLWGWIIQHPKVKVRLHGNVKERSTPLARQRGHAPRRKARGELRFTASKR